jgi:hypothetical protein
MKANPFSKLRDKIHTLTDPGKRAYSGGPASKPNQHLKVYDAHDLSGEHSESQSSDESFNGFPSLRTHRAPESGSLISGYDAGLKNRAVPPVSENSARTARSDRNATSSPLGPSNKKAEFGNPAMPEPFDGANTDKKVYKNNASAGAAHDTKPARRLNTTAPSYKEAPVTAISKGRGAPGTTLQPAEKKIADAPSRKNFTKPDKEQVTNTLHSSRLMVPYWLEHAMPVHLPNSMRTRQTHAVTSQPAPAAVAASTAHYTTSTFVSAARDGNLQMVKLHIEAGLNVNAGPSAFAPTPLTEAAMGGHCDVVKAILPHASEQSKTDSLRALMWTASDQDMENKLNESGKAIVASLKDKATAYEKMDSEELPVERINWMVTLAM